jgi:hypothetical protein
MTTAMGFVFAGLLITFICGLISNILRLIDLNKEETNAQ